MHRGIECQKSENIEVSFSVPEVSFGRESFAGYTYITALRFTSLCAPSVWVVCECVKLMTKYKSELFLLTGNKVRPSEILRANISFYVFQSYGEKMSSIIVTVLSELRLSQFHSTSVLFPAKNENHTTITYCQGRGPNKSLPVGLDAAWLTTPFNPTLYHPTQGIRFLFFLQKCVSCSPPPISTSTPLSLGSISVKFIESKQFFF